MINSVTFSAFADELKKVAGRKLKKKQSGEVTLDRSHFVNTLEGAAERPARGPHPALNYEHQR